MPDKKILQQVAEAIRNRGYEVFENEVVKTNHVKEAISIKLSAGQLISPTFYEDFLDHLIEEEGLNIEGLADKLIEITQTNSPPINIEDLENPDFLKSHAFLAPCNEAWNSALLSDAISEHIEGTDLANYVRIGIFRDGSVKMTPSLLEDANLTREEILDAARQNSHEAYSIKHISEFISGVEDFEMPLLPIMVITYNNNCYGGSAISDTEILKSASEMLGVEEMYIIPASINEIIVVPADGMDAHNMAETIAGINSSDLKDEDVLSNQPYLYSDGKVSFALSQQQTLAVGRSRK